MSIAKRFRFRLKTFLVLATLFCLFIGWRVHAYVQHRNAVDSLATNGIELHYPEAVQASDSLANRLRRAVGPHPIWLTPDFLNVAYVDLSHEDLANLRHLHGIEHAVVVGKNADGQFLKHLGRVDQLRIVKIKDLQPLPTDSGEALLALSEASVLEKLWLENVSLPATGLAFLRGCPNLKYLALPGMPIGDGELSAIANCRLNYLSLPGAQITSQGVEQLERLPRLELLDLSDATITGGGYEAIGRLHPLEVLELAGSNVTDDDLLNWYDLHHLKQLDLSRTAITDEGLMYLKVLSSLESLRLNDTNVTDEAIDQLDAALPAWDRGE